MLETFYNNFGFLGSLGIAFGGFVFIIFWVSGIAGICDSETTRFKTAKMIISVLFPIYPFIWILLDMRQQSQRMKET